MITKRGPCIAGGSRGTAAGCLLALVGIVAALAVFLVSLGIAMCRNGFAVGWAYIAVAVLIVLVLFANLGRLARWMYPPPPPSGPAR